MKKIRKFPQRLTEEAQIALLKSKDFYALEEYIYLYPLEPEAQLELVKIAAHSLSYNLSHENPILGYDLLIVMHDYLYRYTWTKESRRFLKRENLIALSNEAVLFDSFMMYNILSFAHETAPEAQWGNAKDRALEEAVSGKIPEWFTKEEKQYTFAVKEFCQSLIRKEIYKRAKHLKLALKISDGDVLDNNDLAELKNTLKVELTPKNTKFISKKFLKEFKAREPQRLEKRDPDFRFNPYREEPESLTEARRLAKLDPNTLNPEQSEFLALYRELNGQELSNTIDKVFTDPVPSEKGLLDVYEAKVLNPCLKLKGKDEIEFINSASYIELINYCRWHHLSEDGKLELIRREISNQNNLLLWVEFISYACTDHACMEMVKEYDPVLYKIMVIRGYQFEFKYEQRYGCIKNFVRAIEKNWGILQYVPVEKIEEALLAMPIE